MNSIVEPERQTDKILRCSRPYKLNPDKKGINKMKKFMVILSCLLLGLVFSVNAIAKDKCTTIKSGDLVASDGTAIVLGFDDWGYNYQAHMFKGGYCDAYRNAAWCQEYKDVKLSMKWNDAWMSNKDCDGDGALDRHYGFDSLYRFRGLVDQSSIWRV